MLGIRLYLGIRILGYAPELLQLGWLYKVYGKLTVILTAVIGSGYLFKNFLRSRTVRSGISSIGIWPTPS